MPGPAQAHSWLPAGGALTAGGVGPLEEDSNSLQEGGNPRACPGDDQATQGKQSARGATCSFSFSVCASHSRWKYCSEGQVSGGLAIPGAQFLGGKDCHTLLGMALSRGSLPLVTVCSPCRGPSKLRASEPPRRVATMLPAPRRDRGAAGRLVREPLSC